MSEELHVGPIDREHAVAPMPRVRTVTVAPQHRGLLGRAIRFARNRVRGLYWRTRMAAFGRASALDAPAWVVGGDRIAIGTRVHLWRFARLEALCTEVPGLRIEIGDGTVIQPFVHIGAAASVRVGRHCLFASHVYVTDHDHDHQDPSDPPIHNDRLEVAPVTIGDYVWVGERAVVLKGVTIGERSVVAAASVVTKDVPRLSIVAGVPARVVRRWDEGKGAWRRPD